MCCCAVESGVVCFVAKRGVAKSLVAKGRVVMLNVCFFLTICHGRLGKLNNHCRLPTSIIFGILVDVCVRVSDVFCFEMKCFQSAS